MCGGRERESSAQDGVGVGVGKRGGGYKGQATKHTISNPLIEKPRPMPARTTRAARAGPRRVSDCDVAQ